MRANEFTNEAINPNILKPGFNKTQDMGTYTLKAYVDPKYTDPHLMVNVIDKRTGHTIGWTYFQPVNQAGKYIKDWNQINSGSHLEALGTQVNPGQQGQGVASSMYNFARKLGAQIKPSTLAQTPAGEAFWTRGSGGLNQLGKMPAQPDVPGSPAASPAVTKPQTAQQQAQARRRAQNRATVIDVPARQVPNNPAAPNPAAPEAQYIPGTETPVKGPQPQATPQAQQNVQPPPYNQNIAKQNAERSQNIAKQNAERSQNIARQSSTQPQAPAAPQPQAQQPIATTTVPKSNNTVATTPQPSGVPAKDAGSNVTGGASPAPKMPRAGDEYTNFYPVAGTQFQNQQYIKDLQSQAAKYPNDPNIKGELEKMQKKYPTATSKPVASPTDTDPWASGKVPLPNLPLPKGDNAEGNSIATNISSLLPSKLPNSSDLIERTRK
jgi:hypothetical protein